MAFQIIPLDNSPNQTLEITLSIGKKNILLGLFIRWNNESRYWIMQVYDPSTNRIIIDSVPLVTGSYPAGDLFKQYQYLEIGSAYILNMSGIDMDYPDDTNLGTDFILAWGNSE